MNAQLDWLQASTRHAAIRSAGEAAGDDWCRRAAEWLQLFAITTAHNQAFLIEDAVASAPLDLKPREPRAWRAALNYATHRNMLRAARHPDGSRRYATGRVNLSPKPLWVAA